jgi:hypothetical protein
MLEPKVDRRRVVGILVMDFVSDVDDRLEFFALFSEEVYRRSLLQMLHQDVAFENDRKIGT